MNPPGFIDAHQHCWQLARPECHWPTPELAALYRDFTPEQFWEEAGRANAVGSVLVQSQPNPEDTAYLLSLADNSHRILGVVGWVDLSSADAASAIERAAAHRKLCGLRPMLQDLPEADWILSRARADALEVMAEQSLVFDALVTPRQLPFIAELARRHPTLTIVLDHAGKPDIASGDWEPWSRELAALASYPNIACKLSGLVTEMASGQPREAMNAYIDQVLTLFGRERVLWGSDWPVLTLAGDYTGWLAHSRARVALRSPEWEAPVFRDNALHLYGLTLER